MPREVEPPSGAPAERGLRSGAGPAFDERGLTYLGRRIQTPADIGEAAAEAFVRLVADPTPGRQADAEFLIGMAAAVLMGPGGKAR